MAQYINKDALVAEIEKRFDEYSSSILKHYDACKEARVSELGKILILLRTLEVKEVDEQKERISKCPYREVVCTMYTDKTLPCNEACSWVVDYPRLNEFKAQKGE